MEMSDDESQKGEYDSTLKKTTPNSDPPTSLDSPSVQQPRSKTRDKRPGRSRSRSRSPSKSPPRIPELGVARARRLKEIALFEQEIASFRRRERDLEKALQIKEYEVQQKERKIQEFVELQALEALKRKTKKPAPSDDALEALRLGVLRSLKPAEISTPTSVVAPSSPLVDSTAKTTIPTTTTVTTATTTATTAVKTTAVTTTAVTATATTTAVTTTTVTTTTTTTVTMKAALTTASKKTTVTANTALPKPTARKQPETPVPGPDPKSRQVNPTVAKALNAPALTSSKSKKQQELEQMRQELEVEQRRVAQMKKTLQSKALAASEQFDPLKRASLLTEKLQAEKLKAPNGLLKQRQVEFVLGFAISRIA